MTLLPPHAADVLELFGCDGGADIHDALFWRGDSGTFEFYANCSDTFMWGCADLEIIKPDDVPLLRRCYEDLLSYDQDHHLPALYAARKRRHQPMHPYLESDRLPAEVVDMFKACGPPMADPWAKAVDA